MTILAPVDPANGPLATRSYLMATNPAMDSQSNSKITDCPLCTPLCTLHANRMCNQCELM